MWRSGAAAHHAVGHAAVEQVGLAADGTGRGQERDAPVGAGVLDRVAQDMGAPAHVALLMPNTAGASSSVSTTITSSRR
jgi:hypothetical protein